MNISAIASGGVAQAETQFDQAVRRLTSTPDVTATDTVSLISARDQFSTNLQVLKTADQMERKAIDLMA